MYKHPIRNYAQNSLDIAMVGEVLCRHLIKYLLTAFIFCLLSDYAVASCDDVVDRASRLERERVVQVGKLDSIKDTCSSEYLSLNNVSINYFRQQLELSREMEVCPGLPKPNIVRLQNKLKNSIADLRHLMSGLASECAVRARADNDIQRLQSQLDAMKSNKKDQNGAIVPKTPPTNSSKKFFRAEGVGLFTGGSTRKNLKLCELEGSSRCYTFRDGLASGVLTTAMLEALRGHVPGAIRAGQGGLNSFKKLNSSIRYDDGGHVRYHMVDAPLGLGRYAGLLCMAYDAEYGNASPTWEGCGPVDEIRELRTE